MPIHIRGREKPLDKQEIIEHKVIHKSLCEKFRGALYGEELEVSPRRQIHLI